ncbi:hypothetical protein V6N13_147413 [Hibiscus sabdariffa]|uniref:Bet v I/Major latex protein domain-containing protein n=1 Tax=Hibiscus sabdariffa TaxID=183260 RepID=A0ABR2TW36_9ROSI
MKGHLSHDYLIEVPAAVVWDVYRGIVLPKFAAQLLRDVFGSVKVVHGDGGVGTIVKLTYPSGGPSPGYMKEMYTKIDNMIEKDARSSIIRSSVDYEIDDKLQELASQATMKPFEVLNEGIGKYLKQKWDSSNT